MTEEENIKNDNEGDDLFYFESDHVALKGNKDYSDILKTIVILEAQQAQAIQDIDKLIDIQETALEDPFAFLEKMKNKEVLGIPVRQFIPEIPHINWSKYNVPVPEEGLKLINSEATPSQGRTNRMKTFLKYKNLVSHKKSKNKDGSSTHNKPWTSEEQKKLEECLMKFPPEAIEMRRFQKIANALGNRTVKQVTSRVQKYFLKLHRAGLPIPGRIPKTIEKKKSHRHQRHNHLLYKPSTFFPETDVPVYMTEEDDDVPGPSVVPPMEIPDDFSNKVFNFNESVQKKDDIHLKMDILRKIKIQKIQEKDVALAIHIGFQCDLCNEDPINGCRWHCSDCKQDSVDFCTDCVISQLNSSTCHPLSHDLVPIQHPINRALFESSATNLSTSPIPGCSYRTSLKTDIKFEMDSDDDSSDSDGSNSEDDFQSVMKDYDNDYISQTFAMQTGKYNYLDSNFLPQ